MSRETYDNLESLALQKLKNIAMELPLNGGHVSSKKTKSELITDIKEAFKGLDRHKRRTLDKYEIHEQLGDKGKEGITYKVAHDGHEYAMKTFRKTKSASTLRIEAEFQKRASEIGVSPAVIEYDTVFKFIVMDKMDMHLADAIQKQGELFKYQQLRVINIFKRLDEANIFHGDLNIANFMLKGRDIYLIDFGFAKEIDSKLIKKLGTSHPNHRFMIIGLIKKLKELGCTESSYKYLLQEVRDEDREKYL